MATGIPRKKVRTRVTSAAENVRILAEAWKLMVGRMPAAQIVQAGGVTTTFGHVPLAFFNISMLDRPVVDAADLRGLLELAKERAKACQHGSLLTLCEDWAPREWQTVASEAGWTPMMNLTGMAASELLPLRRTSPQLELRRVADEATARDLAMINGHAYGMPPELFECICNLHLWHADSFGYVGYADGRAVSAAATFPVDGTVYVALVATMPDAHGKGYAETVMRQAISQGRQAMGLSRVTLHASDMGQPLYRSMGFESGGRVALLAPTA